MNKTLLCLAACFTINFSFAQSTTPEVISSSGSSFNNGSSQLDWTLGEPATATYSTGPDMLTQGFHQPNLTITSADDPQTAYTVNVFPNPVTDHVQLRFSEIAKEAFTIELYAADGRLLETKKSGTDPEMQLNMTQYKAGVYMLSVKNKGSKAKTYRIIKSH